LHQPFLTKVKNKCITEMIDREKFIKTFVERGDEICAYQRIALPDNATDNFFILELRIVQVRKSYYLFTGVQPVCHSRVIIIDKQKTVRELKMDIFKFFRPLITLPAGRTKYTDEE
jgi:hypothetical protein